MNFPSKLVETAVNPLSRLPGIGKKTALRLVLHMLKQEKIQVQQFGESFIRLINNISYSFFHSLYHYISFLALYLSCNLKRYYRYCLNYNIEHYYLVELNQNQYCGHLS